MYLHSEIFICIILAVPVVLAMCDSDQKNMAFIKFHLNRYNRLAVKINRQTVTIALIILV